MPLRIVVASTDNRRDFDWLQQLVPAVASI